MCMGGGSAPPPPELPPEPPKPPRITDPAVLEAREAERKQRMAMSGMASGIKTSPQGLTSKATTTKKVALGY
jgi:hypothetical protein